MKIIFLSIVSILVLYSSNLKKNGNYVIDSSNYLMWQDHKDNAQITLSQKRAVEYCQKLTLGNYTDWELPSVENYKTIIDKTREDEIMIDKAFKHIVQKGYWTKDRTWRNFGLWGYYIYFKSGTAYYENRTYFKYVRCVRTYK